MKKTLAIILVLLVVFTISVPVTAFGAAAKEITVFVNGQQLVMDQPPIIEDGRTLVPLRAIFEALNVNVGWEKETQTVLADWGDNSLSLQIGKNVINMGDGHKITIDVPAKIVGGRTLVPVRAVSEAMGANVSWNGVDRRVDVTKTWSTYYVRNVGELINAIGSNHKIQLAAGTYNLTEWIEEHSNKYQTEEIEMYLPNVGISEVFDGKELLIKNVRNLFIEPAVSTDFVQLVVEPRYADVLAFDGCEGIYLTNLTMGHTIEKGSCAGSVLNFTDSKKVRLMSLDLYGCGTYGIEAYNTDNLISENTTIRDCSYGVISAYNLSNATFTNCNFKNCMEYTMFECNESSLTFSKCSFSNLSGGLLGGLDSSYYRFVNCTFDDDAWAQVVDAAAVTSRVTMIEPAH